jgi:hypothetical protein
MDKMWETTEDLEAELEVYYARLEKAGKGLDGLPQGFIDYKEHKKRKTKESQLNSEILTVRQIIVYIKEAIDEMRNAIV